MLSSAGAFAAAHRHRNSRVYRLSKGQVPMPMVFKKGEQTFGITHHEHGISMLIFCAKLNIVQLQLPRFSGRETNQRVLQPEQPQPRTEETEKLPGGSLWRRSWCRTVRTNDNSVSSNE
jgi:hypothetical protein